MAIGKFLPTTAVVAIVLFLIKMLLDERNKKADRLRKRNAIKRLLTEEFERNHWTLVSFFRTLEAMRDLSDDETLSLHKDRDGSQKIRITDPNGWTETGIPNFHTSMYQRLLPALAESYSTKTE